MREYTQQLTVEQFGAMVATATRTLGSQRGPYLGYTPSSDEGSPCADNTARRPSRRDRWAPFEVAVGTLSLIAWFLFLSRPLWWRRSSVSVFEALGLLVPADAVADPGAQLPLAALRRGLQALRTWRRRAGASGAIRPHRTGPRPSQGSRRRPSSPSATSPSPSTRPLRSATARCRSGRPPRPPRGHRYGDASV